MASWKRAGSPFPFPSLPFRSHLQKENHASIRGFFVPIPRRFSRPLLRPWGRVFRFSAEIGIRDYIINIHVTPFVVEGARLPSSSSRGDGRSTRAQSSRARDTCRRNRVHRAAIQCTVTCIVYGRYHICLRTEPRASQPSLLSPPPSPSSFPCSLSLSLSPSSLPRLRLLRRCSAPWAERSGTHLLARIPTARGIKYNKDIQWELIGYLRIYRSLRAALLLRRGPRDGARAPPPLFSPRSFFSSLFPTPPPSLPPLLRSLLFVFHLFAGRAAGSNGDIPRWNNIEPRF